MSHHDIIRRLARCTTIAQTQRIERDAFSRRAWPQVHADLIRLAGIARRFELTRSDDCATFVQPFVPLSRGARASNHATQGENPCQKPHRTPQ